MVNPPLVSADDAVDALTDRPQAFFNALLTEHFVLESARSITVSESSSRASLYLTTLSSSLVAFGFLARTSFATAYLAAVVPAVVLLGVFTYERLVETSLEDVVALQGIQRIRRFYARLLPGAERYFAVPDADRALNELIEIGRPASWRGVFFTVSSAVGAVNSVVAAAGVGYLLAVTSVGTAAAVAGAVAAGVVLVVAHGGYQLRRWNAMRRRLAGEGVGHG